MSGRRGNREQGTGNREQGTGNREQEWRLPRTFRYCTSCSGPKGLTSCRPKGLTSCRGNLPPPFPADKNAVAADCRRYRAYRDIIFIAGTFPSFWLQHSVRGFSCSLLTVPCSLFPLYYPLLFHQQLDKSEFLLLYQPRRPQAVGAELDDLLQRAAPLQVLGDQFTRVPYR